MSESITFDIGGLLPYAEDKIAAVFGRDYASKEAGARLDKHLRIAAKVAGVVQIVGMDRPVSIFDIYQPTRLRRPWRNKSETMMFGDLLRQKVDAVITGGPGAGKTVFAHYVFAQLARDGEDVPILVTLRWPDAPDDLETLVEDLASGRLKRLKKQRLVLIVDGYDEITVEERSQVAHSLRQFAALDVGNFYLTCRSYYSTDEVQASRLEIAPFTREDSSKFVAAFSRAYGADLDVAKLLVELTERGFSDFAEHPLMLALVCILKSGPMPSLPRTAIGLIRRAISTLTFRWDEAKGIYRRSRLEIDGEDRVRCMMRIAYEMRELVAPDQSVRSTVRDYLKILQKPNIDSRLFLDEIAQWYGMLVPVSETQWAFVHRTIHDFLAAQHWVESGTFKASKVSTWNTRAAYAACLVPDATASIVKVLAQERELNVFIECLYNGALFDVVRVADAVVQYFTLFRQFRHEATPAGVVVETSRDFFSLTTDEFLESLVCAAASARTPAHELVLGFALAEVWQRQLVLSPHAIDAVTMRFRDSKSYKVRRPSGLVNVTRAVLEIGA